MPIELEVRRVQAAVVADRERPDHVVTLIDMAREDVAAYVRALQVSRNARLEQIPADQAAANGWGMQ